MPIQPWEDPMNRSEYDRYVAAFNGRDYDTLHSFFTEDVSMEVRGVQLKGKAAIRGFYDVFHQHVREHIVIEEFIPGEEAFAALGTIEFTGLTPFTRANLYRKTGYSWRKELAPGEVYLTHQMLWYNMRDGKVCRIRPGVIQMEGGADVSN
jgi:ketosteroid isomerase-like protein